MIILKVGNIFTDIEGSFFLEAHSKLQQALSFRPEGFQFSTLYNRWVMKDGKRVRRMWDGWRRQIWRNRKTKNLYFPTGLLSIVRDYLSGKEIAYELIDTRIKPEPNIILSLDDSWTIRPYQLKIINDSCQVTRGIIQAATGSGKTICAGGIIQKLSVAPFIFFVTSIDLLTQAKESFESILLCNNKKCTIGQVGGGIIDIRDINVMTVQTAVRVLGQKWNQKLKFDSADRDDKTPVESRREDILNLLHQAKGVICDECVSGDAAITTRQGSVLMRELNKYIGKDILSFDGNSVVWKKLTHFYSKGKKKTLKITLENGNEIKCTEDHPIMTRRGWRLAKRLRHEDQILCCVNVDVDKKFVLRKEAQVNTPSTSLGIKLKNDQQKNGKKYLITQQKQHHFANVGAGNKLNCTQGRLSRLSTEEAVLNIVDFSMDTTNVPQNGTCDYLSPRNKQSLEHFLETRLFPFPLKEVKIQDSTLTMGCASPNGRSLNQFFSVGCLQNTGNMITEDTERDRLRLGLVVIQKSKECTTSLSIKIKKELRNNGSIALEKLDSHGGYATTDRVEKVISKYIPKVSQKKKFILLLNGSQKNMDQHQCMSQEDTLPCILKKEQETELFPESKSISQIACGTNYTKIKSISSLKEEDVFDITIEDAHCFFANGVLVHNCQHWRAETCQLIAKELKSAYYTFATSATPYRDSGDDLMIQACFGKKIAQITASELIRQKWLIKPSIKIVHIRGETSRFRQWQQLYKDQVSENKIYNQIVANIANSYIAAGRLVLVLIQQIVHGKLLAPMIPGSVFLSGNSPKKKREENIKLLREKKISCIIASTIFDEGIDVRPLDTVLLAGQGKSRVRAMQRIGRILRPYPGKTTATAIDFRIHQKYLLTHSLEREKMYRTEEEYDIEEIDNG